jgi:hypothetical protein
MSSKKSNRFSPKVREVKELRRANEILKLASASVRQNKS